MFPACENGQVDPSRGIANWRTAWRRITGSIQCPVCGETQNPGKKCRNVECGAKIPDIKNPLEGLRFHISGTPRPQSFWNRGRLLQLWRIFSDGRPVPQCEWPSVMVISDRKHSGRLWRESPRKKFRQVCTNLCTNPDVGYNRRCLTE